MEGIESRYGGMHQLPNGNASTVHASWVSRLKADGVKAKQVTGGATDGASVMIGKFFQNKTHTQTCGYNFPSLHCVSYSGISLSLSLSLSSLCNNCYLCLCFFAGIVVVVVVVVGGGGSGGAVVGGVVVGVVVGCVVHTHHMNRY
jgi:H+/Cl- antiporter ClcA